MPDNVEINWREFFETTNLVHWSKNFIKSNPIYYDSSKIWWKWDKNYWRMIDEIDVLNAIYSIFGTDVFTSSYRKNKILTAMQMSARENAPKELPSNSLQFKNCFLFLDAENMKYEVKPISPEYFSTNDLPWSFSGVNRETPTIDKLFVDWVGEDNTSLLYEISAYSMLQSNPIHRLFFLLGHGRNGKGSYQKFLSKLVGQRNIASTDLSRLRNSRFEIASLYKKLIAFIGEIDFNILRDTAFIKSITGEDFITAEFKNKTPFTFVNYAKLIIATNGLPMTGDRSSGFYSRPIIVDFPNTFDEGKDIIKSIPDSEYEAFGNKCVGTLMELLKRGKFSNEGSIENRMRRYEERSNPVKYFIVEYCEQDFNGHIPVWQFYNYIQAFLEMKKFRKLTHSEIRNMVYENGYDIKKKNISLPNGGTTSWMCILGLKWKYGMEEVLESMSTFSRHTQRTGQENE